MLPIALHWIAEHGYIALFSLMTLGIVGLPIPDETLLTYAGYLVDKGDLQFHTTVVAAFLGCSCGITLSFGIGHLLSLRSAQRLRKWLHLTPEKMEHARDWFTRIGKWSLTIGYFVPGLRHLVAISAGAANLPVLTFALYAYPGGLFWCCTFIGLGVFLGEEWTMWSQYTHTILLAIGALLTCTILIHWFRRHRRPA